MKICFLITGLGVGGAEKLLLERVPYIKFESFIISLTSNDEFGKKLEEKGIRVYYLGLKKFNLLLTILRFGKILRKEKPDLIDSYLIHSNILGSVFGRIFGVKKIICSVQTNLSHLKFLNFLDSISQHLANLYILASDSLINYVHNKRKVPFKKIITIPNGVNIEKIYENLDKNYDIRKELDLKSNSFIIVGVGRLHTQKNFTTLIKAMKLVNKNIYLVIAGNGIEKKNLQDLTKKLNLKDRIFFLGIRKDVFNIINNSNLFILPSLYEGMSNALLEAMALKKCCIVSDIPENVKLIKDNFNGIIFKKENDKDLANKIENIFRNQNLKKMGEAAYKLVKEKYQVKNLIIKYEKFIEKVLSNDKQ